MKTSGGWPIYSGPMRDPQDKKACPICSRLEHKKRPRLFTFEGLISHLESKHGSFLDKVSEKASV